MRNMVWLVSIAALLVVVAGCGGGGKYADAKKAINTQYEMMDEFTAEIDKAQDSKAVIAALNRFKEAAEGSKDEMMQLSKKYPELMDKKNPPKELQAEMEKMEELMPRFIGAMMKIGQQYGSDPEVKKILAEMQSVMAPPQE